MQKILITGAQGTIGQAVSELIKASGHRAISWDRTQHDPLQPDHYRPWIQAQQPDALIHLALASSPSGQPDEGHRINVAWSLQLAEICADLTIPMIFSSTAMVYDASANGPYTPASPVNLHNDYGRDKHEAEVGTLLRHPTGVRVARLGWQIDPTRPDGNQMVAHAHREQQAHGRVSASDQWWPACSFLQDTAAALLGLLDQPPGLYLLDSNRGWDFVTLLQALKAAHGFNWQIAPNQDYRHDQRMIDGRINMPSLAQHLPLLADRPIKPYAPIPSRR
ncbi:MAG: sugar nucleotide-binding protein [Betaproteobacteria bacterium]|nr:sugar nucleotide-binding protein [Betaproteobacteria bacterium]